MQNTSTPARPAHRLRTIGAAASVGALLAVGLPVLPAAAATPGDYSGTLDDGTDWVGSVPENFNGTVLLYGHGYQPSFAGPRAPATAAPSTASAELLLERGYAIVGSTYESTGWAVPTAPGDQLESLDAFLADADIDPERILAYGTSMGGLVTGRLAEHAGDVLDGAMPTCGLMHGGVDLNNYQLDGAHAIDVLLAPGADLDIESYAHLGEAFAAIGSLQAAVDAGQSTPDGRARVALAAALFHLAGGDTGDLDAWQATMYSTLRGTLGFVTPGRFDIEQTAGGNATSNAGVDYGALFADSEDYDAVAALYAQAGLDLDADLDALTDAADITADPGSLETLFAHSGLTGDLQMPVLTMHTLVDNLAPVNVEEEYAEDVRANGANTLLRQVWVDRPGHCSFTAAEIVAGIEVLEKRVITGRWGGESNSASKLNRLAASIDDSGSAFVQLAPQEFVGDRYPI